MRAKKDFSTVIGVSMPIEAVKGLDSLARSNECNRSEMLRELIYEGMVARGIAVNW